MELPHIGQNCALKECNRLDFLPVKCDACSSVFCLEHYRYERHNCDKAKNKDFQVPVCPLCMEPVVAKRDQLPDIAVSEHIDKFCKENEMLKTNLRAKKKTDLQACSHKSCRQKDVIYLECGDCKSKFCIKHRHPTDHCCPGPKPTSLGSTLTHNLNSFKDSCSSGATSSYSMMKNKAQQITKSGQAALNRLATGSRNRSPTVNNNTTTASSQLANNLQGGLSEQEALAIALSESATNSTNGVATDRAQVEDEDSLLARAIHESELETARRQNPAQKDTCVLS
uniref:AN1-type zinc finger protein 2B n=1 Tax=Aceria tosichella TaxID=561515 RepID=A0A6G1SHY4_9ACAR